MSLTEGAGLNRRACEIADRVEPRYRDAQRSYSCGGTVAKLWGAAYEGAKLAIEAAPASDEQALRDALKAAISRARHRWVVTHGINGQGCDDALADAAIAALRAQPASQSGAVADSGEGWSGPLTDDEQAMIDRAWEHHKLSAPSTTSANERPAEPSHGKDVWYRGWEIGWNDMSAKWTGSGWDAYKGGCDIGAPRITTSAFSDCLDEIDDYEDGQA